MSNVVQLKIYQVIKVKGIERLACKVGKKWIFDSTCDSLNNMLDDGLISTDTIQSWIASRAS